LFLLATDKWYLLPPRDGFLVDMMQWQQHRVSYYHGISS